MKTENEKVKKKVELKWIKMHNKQRKIHWNKAHADHLSASHSAVHSIPAGFP